MSRDWTFAHVALLTGVPISTLAAIERRKNQPNDRTLRKLLKALPGLVE